MPRPLRDILAPEKSQSTAGFKRGGPELFADSVMFEEFPRIGDISQWPHPSAVLFRCWKKVKELQSKRDSGPLGTCWIPGTLAL